MKRVLKTFCLMLITVFLLTFIQFPAANADNVQKPKSNESNYLDNAIVLYVGSPNAIVNNVDRQIDPKDEAVKPFVLNNSVFVPIRFISEALGAVVEYDKNTGISTIKSGKSELDIFPGELYFKLNGSKIKLDVPVQYMQNRTFVPLRQVSEAFGKKIFYDRGLIVVSDIENIFDKVKDKEKIDEIISRVNNLPVLGDADKLKQLIGNYNNNYRKSYVTDEVMNSTAEGDTSKSLQSQKNMNKKTQDYSKTNVQVEGVDESDMVKTDGEYIYQVNKRRVLIIKAYPAEEMKVVSSLDFTDKELMPEEIYVDGDKLVVIGETAGDFPMYYDGVKRVSKCIHPPYRNQSMKAIIYNIADKASIKQVREVEIEGNYISSRKIGTVVYLIANRYVNYYTIQNSEENATPSYRDTAVKDDFVNIDYKDIRYIPGLIEPSYMTIAGIDISNNSPAQVGTYLGAGSNIYASAQSLYIALSGYANNRVSLNKGIVANNQKTNIYKFQLNNMKVTYLALGEVPGRIQNQFSMDENGEYFRIATTSNKEVPDAGLVSMNNIYVLDATMSCAGKIEDIAPGEIIYSTRFMGDRAYMVTFRTVDPFYVIDLKDPLKPSVLGALKIPGFSDYLQPYDENHIIGFGKDTVELPDSYDKKATMAYYMGMKVALFDVSDVKNPKQMYSTSIGDRGTDSEILTNHKALLFSKDKNLLAFPVTVAEVRNKQAAPSTEYGHFVYQGAYVYNLDLKSGFSLKGRITHVSDEEYKKAGDIWYESEKNVRRILYIGDTLYTLSDSMIKANSIDNLKELGSIAY